jgi:hypothetical protein
MMSSTSLRLLILLGVMFLGIWGCAENSSANSKLRQLEARYLKLEEDHQAAAAANDSFRKKLADVDAQRAELAKQVEELQVAVRERDELRRQLTTRTGERDAFHTQLLNFSKELQNLAGRVEAAANPTAPARSLTSTVSEFQ